MAQLTDWNSFSGFCWLTLSPLIAKENSLERRSHCICATDEVSFSQQIQSLRGPLWGQQECSFILLLGSISYYGLRAAYLSREPARHRSLSGRAAPQAVSLWLQWTSQTGHAGRANETRDWRIYRDFAHSLIQIARPLYAHSELGLELEATAYAFDATTIDLCLSLFPWAKFRKHKGAIKLHTGALSLSLANRTVLQMDPATSPHQKLFRHLRQQRQDQIWIAVTVTCSHI